MFDSTYKGLVQADPCTTTNTISVSDWEWNRIMENLASLLRVTTETKGDVTTTSSVSLDDSSKLAAQTLLTNLLTYANQELIGKCTPKNN